MAAVTRNAVLAALWDAAWRARRRTLLALLLLVLAKVAAVLVPLMLKAIVDRFSDPGQLGVPVTTEIEAAARGAGTVLVVPVFLLLSYALLRFASTLFTEMRDLVFARVTQTTVASFAERAFAHLLRLGPRFHTRRSTGSVIRAVERGTAGVGFLLGAGLFTLAPTFVEFCAVLAVLAIGYSLWFTLIVIVTFAVYATHTMIFSGRREVHQRRVNEMDARATGRLVDCLINYESIKTNAREGFERERYAGMMAQWVDDSVQNQRALSTLHIGQSAIIAGGVAAVMLLAGEQMVRGEMTVGDLVLVNAYIIQICLPLNALGFVFRQARDALVDTEALLALMNERPDIEERPDAPPLRVAAGNVSFENVDFAYEPGRQVLWDVTLGIPAGHKVAVVGGSGSGKSTLARLLLRSYDVASGRITIDGQDVRDVDLVSLRDAIGVVPQDTTLFNDTIAYNIAYGRPGSGMADVIAAAQAAQVHEFIMSLPEQYETVVGERGLKLSGGEKQRIAIARALLKNPPIMIFDEATSALDTRAERAIQAELDRIAQGRTTLVIAHRLTTIVDADEIVVLDRGKVVERGRHADLLAREGLYAQLWNLQRQQQAFERLERRLARQPVNLAVLLADAVDGLRPMIDARQVRLYTSLDLDNARVTGDPGTLSQALREVCVRALQSTPPGGRMELRLERHGANARVRVTDGRHDGAPPAPPPPVRRRGAGARRGAASDPVAPATELNGHPYGIDTPLDPLELRSTLERQGGRFEIEPATSVQGMSYVIELPLRVVDDVPPHEAAGTLEPPQLETTRPLQGLRVICIDDEADARETLQHLLETYGADVLAFASGSPALAWLAERHYAEWPQVLVSDIALGGEDGYAVMRRLRQLEAERGVPLERRIASIALTGLAQEADRIQSLMAGYQVHMAKPVDPVELVAGIQAVAGRE